MKESDNLSFLPVREQAQANQAPSNTRGTVVAVTTDGIAMVDFANNPRSSAIEAETLLSLPASAQEWLSLPCPVMLSFMDNDWSQPVITGFLRKQLLVRPGHTENETPIEGLHQQGQKVTANFIELEGREEIQLNCGKSSIALKKNGQIIIKGEKISNRARRTNKIKGSAVRIN